MAKREAETFSLKDEYIVEGNEKRVLKNGVRG